MHMLHGRLLIFVQVFIVVRTCASNAYVSWTLAYSCTSIYCCLYMSLQQNTPITTRVFTTKMIIVVIHILLHQFIRFRCKSYLKTDNLLLQK